MEGLSGAQFIREKDFHSTVLALEKPEQEIKWLNASDPAQIWGKVLTHQEGKGFTCIPGTLVAMKGGNPIAVMERQGKTLRFFAGCPPEECLALMQLFVEDFRQKRIFAGLKRIVVKDYPVEGAGALSGAGFIREMQDYVLYR
ncbi:hypothetical protein [Eisenbergiella massiliensis]|uniref:hypothetical protein n=1 Tax=Eisenbergiella massiliensis TaxID=1720294 RepID=UPI00399190A3